ncbi:hypothetical protein MTO96_047775 [Rhipicephalus appendiculatus]
MPKRKSSKSKSEAADDHKHVESQEGTASSRPRKARSSDVSEDAKTTVTVTTSQARIVQSSPTNVVARKKTTKSGRRASEDSVITEVISTVSYTVKTKRTYIFRAERHPSSSGKTSSRGKDAKDVKDQFLGQQECEDVPPKEKPTPEEFVCEQLH